MVHQQIRDKLLGFNSRFYYLQECDLIIVQVKNRLMSMVFIYNSKQRYKDK